VKFNSKYKDLFKLLSDDPEHIKEMEGIRYVVLTGGRGSGKSFGLAAWVNGATYKKNWGVLFTRYTMSAAYLSIIPEFRSMCEGFGNDTDFEFKQNEVLNCATGTQIDYRGLKPSSKTANSALKSVAGKNVLIIEECEELADQALFDKVDLSIRTKDNKNIVVLVLNPSHINHFIYTEFIKEKRDDVLLIHTSYLDNEENLDETFLKLARRTKERNLKKYNHLFLGHWLSDSEGALFRMVDIERCRIPLQDYSDDDIQQIVVAWDPAITDSKNGVTESGNEPDMDGIVVCARDKAGLIYCLGDYSMHGTRSQVVKKLIDIYYRLECNAIVIEANQGGDFLKLAIRQVDSMARIQKVTASKSKSKRAGPTQVLVEEEKMRHVGTHSELEYEMVTWVPDTGMKSPNRLDAYVWANTALIKNIHTAPKAYCF
jgi:phage terminase large subunit-like protein